MDSTLPGALRTAKHALFGSGHVHGYQSDVQWWTASKIQRSWGSRFGYATTAIRHERSSGKTEHMTYST